MKGSAGPVSFLATLIALLALAAPAFAAPEWGLAVSHHNAYGAQRASCPGGIESLPGEPFCGVDPFTGSGTVLSRESGLNEYKITVTNTGSMETAGPVTVVDKLPAGIVVAGSKSGPPGWFQAGGPGWGPGTTEGDCTIASDGGAVTCVRQEAPFTLAAGTSFPPIVIHVNVNANATSAADLVSVSGGGAATVSASDPTTVTEAVPFGINRFTTSAVDALGVPFTAAAGHPFAASAELVLNYTPSLVGGGLHPVPLSTAGGGPKSVTVDLPPGFVGNPQAAAQCPLSVLARGPVIQCPPASAVGYADVVTEEGLIVGGVARPFSPILNRESAPLVYNLQPAPGHPAEFGLRYASGAALFLSGKVRSDGDYGLTISGDGIDGVVPKLLASKFTFCENGATQVEGAEGVTDSCNPVSAQSQAFLTNPAKCSTSAPTTTVRSVPWTAPATEVSKTVFTGTNLVEEKASEAESFVTGCDSPELSSRWNASSIGLIPETRQADAPMGMRFDLATPQNSEAGKLATPELKNTTVVLPKGMSISPSAAAGLEACADAQIALHSLSAGLCPDGSQVGTAEAFTPLLSASPVAEGGGYVGERLVCTSGTWNGRPALSYQWLRNGSAISGANGREYTVQKADEGKSLQCQVAATNAGGSSVAVSREVVVAEAVFNEEGEFVGYKEPANTPLQQTRLASPSGTVSVGHELSCANAIWKGEPAFAYAWLRNGAPIAGAEAAQYTLTAADEGTAVQCQVTATNAGGSVLADGEAAVVSPQPTTLPPLLGAPVQGKVFIGSPLCSPCTIQDAQEGHIFRLFIELTDHERGVIVKLPGTVAANPATGQLTATFDNNPQLPLEDIQLAFKGGPRATLATPQTCGEAKTTSDLTPWSSEPGIHEAQGTPDAFPSSSFNVDWDGHGGVCPSSVPFAPGFLAQTASSAAGAFTPFTVEFSRGDREQDLGGVSVQTPPGLLGKIAGIPQCPEAQANAGSCSPESQIGTSTAQAGAGPDPFTVSGGRVYLTGPYKGQPFGLSIVVPAVAGPFNLGNVVVRAAIAVNPSTGQLTVASDPLPQIQDGVPLRLRRVKVEVNRPNFIFNPTNCAAQNVVATLTGVPLNAGESVKSSGSSSAFAAGGCASLPFAPSFSASTQGMTSKANGASLDVKIATTPGEANIQKVDAQLPKLLPARLTTLQKACTDAQFAANPAGCPAASDVGSATAHTPVLSNPLVGPAYLVSHGGAAFPDLEVVLQGEGITLVLDGGTNIKNGITYSRFETVPDAPISSFELNLPQGPHSALATNLPAKARHSLCGQKPTMPTTITAQNGKQVIQRTRIAVTGCKASKPLTRAQLLAKALKTCKKLKPKKKRHACEASARKKYGLAKKAKKRSRGGY
jgi:hypothetical protein